MARPEVTVWVDGRVVCERCLVADRPWARMRGLLGRTELPRGEGILLRPAGSIHTFFMRFPIDVVFIDRDGTVVGVDHALNPVAHRAAQRREGGPRTRRRRGFGRNRRETSP